MSLGYLRVSFGELERMIAAGDHQQAIERCAYFRGTIDVLANFGTVRQDAFLEGALRMLEYIATSSTETYKDAYLRGIHDTAEAFGLVVDFGKVNDIFSSRPVQNDGIREKIFNVTGHEVDLFDYLKAHPGVSEYEIIWKNVWKKSIPKTKRARSAVGDKIHVTVSHLRRELQPYGMAIICERNKGYGLIRI